MKYAVDEEEQARYDNQLMISRVCSRSEGEEYARCNNHLIMGEVCSIGQEDEYAVHDG